MHSDSDLPITVISTTRLLLRHWCESDKPLFAELNADPDVMQYFPSPLSGKESDALAEKIQQRITANGWGFWALEHRKHKQFMGFTGINMPDYTLPVSPCVEIGWRLAKPFWGNGYATEAAQAVLKYAFHTLGLTEIYAFTSVQNTRSRAVMERLNMVNTGLNFPHPLVPRNSPLSEHCLYKIEYQREASPATS